MTNELTPEEIIEQLQKALKDDATDLWTVTNAIKKEIKSREWILEGRGSYEWDDDRYKDETRLAFEAVLRLIDNVQHPAQLRFHQAQLAKAQRTSPDYLKMSHEANLRYGTPKTIAKAQRTSPDREKIAWDILYKMVTVDHQRMDIEELVYEYADQILALIPDIEQAKKEGGERIIIEFDNMLYLAPEDNAYLRILVKHLYKAIVDGKWANAELGTILEARRQALKEKDAK